MKINSEDHIHIYVSCFLKKLQLKGGDFIFLHVPNGGKRNKQEAAKLKMMGVLPGTPDLLILSNGIAHFVELKTITGSLSVPQKELIPKLKKHGFLTDVIYADTPKEAIDQIAIIMADIFGCNHQDISS